MPSAPPSSSARSDERDARDGERREALRQRARRATRRARARSNRLAARDRQHDGDEHRGHLRQRPLERRGSRPGPNTPTASAAPTVSPSATPLHEAAELVDEAVGVDREAEELRQLADEDGQRQPVHVADHRGLRDQVGDEAELARCPPSRVMRADHQRERRGERDRPCRVAVRARPAGGSSRRSSARATSPARARGSSTARRPRTRPGRGSTCTGR